MLPYASISVEESQLYRNINQYIDQTRHVHVQGLCRGLAPT